MQQDAPPPRSARHGKFIWCELMTSDTKAAGDFYASVVGWRINEMSMPGMPSYFVFEAGDAGMGTGGGNGGGSGVSTGGGTGMGGMMTFPPKLEGRLPPNWTGYVAVDDVDRTARDYEALGGRVQRAPDDIPGVGRFAVVADPQGAVLCVMTPIAPDSAPPELGPEHPGPDQPGPDQPGPDQPGNVGWRELMAGNGEAAFDFYATLFGWTRDHDFDMGGMGVYRIFAHAGQAIGGMMTKPDSVPMPCWFYYFNVEAIDAAIGRITAGGGRIVHGPMEVPGGSFIVQATDPQGAFFCLVAPRR